MAYNPITDFLGLMRLVAGGTVLERMPGLDYVVAALARAGIFRLSTGQTAPNANQATTVWLKPAEPSWTAEGVVFLWDADAAAYVLATPTLWTALLTAPPQPFFQRVAVAAAVVGAATTLLAVQRTAPVTTALALPPVALRFNKVLRLVDWSAGVTGHQITLTPNGAETIMRLPTFNLFSTADQLAGVNLYPSTDLNGWVIAP